MTDTADRTEEDFLIFGLDDKAKPRAGLVGSAEREAALALALKLKLHIVNISTAQHRVLAGELSPINIAEVGYAAIPIVKRAVVSELERAAQDQGSDTAGQFALEQPNESLERAAGKLWDHITVGQVILAQEDNPKDGWWEAIVLHELEGGEVLLRYRDYSPEYRFVRRRDQLALLKSA